MNRKQIVFIVLLIAILVALPVVIKTDSTINLAVLRSPVRFLWPRVGTSWAVLAGRPTWAMPLSLAWGLWQLASSGYRDGTSFPVFWRGALGCGIGPSDWDSRFPAQRVYFAIGTLALAQILYITVGNTFSMISSIPAQDLAVYQLAPRYYLFLGVALLTIGTAYVLVNSRLGLGIMAVREEEDAAESLGVSALKHKLLALSVSAFFAGLTGGAFAFYHVGYYPQLTFGPEWTFDSMMMAYIGGVGTIVGPIIGAVFFVILREFLALNLAEMHLIVFGILFILVVLFLPGGFVGLWAKTRKALARR